MTNILGLEIDDEFSIFTLSSTSNYLVLTKHVKDGSLAWQYIVQDIGHENTLELNPDQSYVVIATNLRSIILSTLDGTLYNSYEMPNF